MRFIGLAALSAVPLQWFVLLSSSTGGLRLHQVALFAFTFLVAAHWGVAHVARRLHVFLLANLYMFIILITMNIYHGDSPLDPILQLIYIGVFLAVATYFFQARNAADFRLVDALRWTTVSTTTVLICALGLSMVSNGVNPIGVVQEAIAAGDPTFLQQEFFRSSFIGFGLSADVANANMRHGVFGGLLFTMYVSSWATTRRPLAEPMQRIVYRSAMVVASMLLLLSLSRAILIAALLWPAISFCRALVTGRVSPRQQLAVLPGVLAVVGLAMTGFLEVVWIRFTDDTRGYATRTNLLGQAFDNIRANFWTGGVDLTRRNSSHNLVLDAWLHGGILAGISALVVLLLIFLLWLALILRLRTMSMELVPLVAAMALPCVRLVTQGGGLMQPAEWVTLGFVMGVLVAIRLGEDRAASTKPAPEVRAAVGAGRGLRSREGKLQATLLAEPGGVQR